ncbi:nuclear transport factor 2 family protein [Mucilaginibacter sp. X4EP1]|uniref:nuclear transport factor 2 family protein n=1 Tax=Mucilaginibacter sp. X4EP1 TaxID=2723092 RepID=UPI00216A397A|nr:nuclear transport factor 2 family protein [Mucilaginibacter sp. X4EP1]MCS3816548.1 ketosteroid isomerase-like protein [Mucilaginibacter sp. X4EP1]
MKTINKFFTVLLLITAATFTVNRAAAQTSGPLFNEIAQQDSLQFDAFNSRNLDKLMNYFDTTLELYQDNTGVRNFEQTKQAFGGLFKMSYVLNRKLIAGSMEVYPIKDYGAIETGQHIFSHVENGKLQSFTFKFMQIWQKKDGVWRVTREITYGH